MHAELAVPVCGLCACARSTRQGTQRSATPLVTNDWNARTQHGTHRRVAKAAKQAMPLVCPSTYVTRIARLAGITKVEVESRAKELVAAFVKGSGPVRLS